jgi:hypothetical protein
MSTTKKGKAKKRADSSPPKEEKQGALASSSSSDPKKEGSEDERQPKVDRHRNISRLWRDIERESYVPDPTHPAVRSDKSENKFVLPIHASVDEEATKKSARLKNSYKSTWRNSVPNRDWERGAAKIWRMHVFCMIVYAAMFCTLIVTDDLLGTTRRSMPLNMTMTSTKMKRGEYLHSEPTTIFSFNVMFLFKLATFGGCFAHFLSVRPFNNQFLRVTYQAGVQMRRDMYRFTHYVFSWPGAVLAFVYMCGMHDVFKIFCIFVSCLGVGYSFYYVADRSRRSWLIFMNRCVSPRMHVKFTKRGVTHFPRNNAVGYAGTLGGKRVETESGVLDSSAYHINLFARVLTAGMRIYGVHPFSMFPSVFAQKDHISQDDVLGYWTKLMTPYLTALIDSTSHYIAGLACMFIYCALVWNGFIFNQMNLDSWSIHIDDLHSLSMWIAFFAVFFVPVLAFMFSAAYLGDSMRSKQVFSMHTATVAHNLIFCAAHVAVFWAVMHYVNESDAETAVANTSL